MELTGHAYFEIFTSGEPIRRQFSLADTVLAPLFLSLPRDLYSSMHKLLGLNRREAAARVEGVARIEQMKVGCQ
jgi:hypothetical protein